MRRPVHELVYESQPEEHAFRVTKIEGTIPAALRGTMLRAAPGLMDLGGEPLNFFDGHAQIGGITFADGEAIFRSRFVRTPLYEEERAANAVLVRHVFTNHPSRWKNFLAMKIQNTAMHDVYAWGEGEDLRVVAGNDPGHFALDPRTLETLGRPPWTCVPKGCDTGPMPSPDASTGRLVGYAKKPGLKDQIKFFTVDAHWKTVEETPFHALSRGGVITHDQRATATWFLVTEQPFQVSLAAAAWGERTLFDSFELPAGATSALLLVPRGGGPLVRVPLPRPHAIAFHVINAYDEGEHVVVDATCYTGAIGFARAAPRKLRERLGARDAHGPIPKAFRFVVDPKRGAVVESKQLGDAACEVPEIADAYMGKPYRYVYSPTVSEDDDVPDRGGYFLFGTLAKLDVTTGAVTRWSAGPDAVVSAPVFAPRDGGDAEDDGWVLAWVLREGGASAVVLDAKDLAKGPIATLALGIHLPGVSHARFARDVALRA